MYPALVVDNSGFFSLISPTLGFIFLELDFLSKRDKFFFLLPQVMNINSSLTPSKVLEKWLPG